MSGLVKVRYGSAPARLRKSVGSATGGPSVDDNLAQVSMGVEHGLQSVMPVRSEDIKLVCGDAKASGVLCEHDDTKKVM